MRLCCQPSADCGNCPLFAALWEMMPCTIVRTFSLLCNRWADSRAFPSAGSMIPIISGMVTIDTTMPRLDTTTAAIAMPLPPARGGVSPARTNAMIPMMSAGSPVSGPKQIHERIASTRAVIASELDGSAPPVWPAWVYPVIALPFCVNA